MCLQIKYLIYEKDLALNNLQWLVCHKIQTNFVFIIHPIIDFLFIKFHLMIVLLLWNSRGISVHAFEFS